MRNHRAFRNTQQFLLDLGLIRHNGAGEGVTGARLASEEIRKSAAGYRLGGPQCHSRLLCEFNESFESLVRFRDVQRLSPVPASPVRAMDTQPTDQ